MGTQYLNTRFVLPTLVYPVYSSKKIIIHLKKEKKNKVTYLSIFQESLKSKDKKYKRAQVFNIFQKDKLETYLFFHVLTFKCTA